MDLRARLTEETKASMRAGDAPMSRAAEAKSSSRKASSLERTARACPVQSIRPRISVMPKKTHKGSHSTGRAALSDSQSGMTGKELMTSISRCIILSIQPP